MTKSLFKGTEPEEPVKLDLSDCKLTSEYILKLNADVSLISFIFELNLAGNPIGQEVCKFKFCLTFFPLFLVFLTFALVTFYRVATEYHIFNCEVFGP